MPAALRPAFLESLARDSSAAGRIDKQGCAFLATQALKGCFDTQGAHFSGPGDSTLTLRLDAVGRESRQTKLDKVSPKIAGDRATFEHPQITEWWRALPVGFEQGFTVAKRPTGDGDLTLALASSNASNLRDGTLAWDKFRYGGLVVTDANGTIVPSTLKNESKRVVLAIDDEHAQYPLSIDPVLWTEQKVTQNDSSGDAYFGWAVALDGAGTTALISLPSYNFINTAMDPPTAAPQGAVYVFTNSGGVWTQSQKLSASDGALSDNFGYGVAISGTTAIISSIPQDNFGNFIGGNAVYVFTNSGGTWVQQQKLTASDGVPGDSFAFVMDAIATDGSTIVVGATNATIGANVGQGAAYIYNLQNGTWIQTQKLTVAEGASRDYFGYAVGVHNNVAVVSSVEKVGGVYQAGAAYVFAQAGGTWEQVQKLTAPDATAGANFGGAIALDDSTLLVGAPTQNANGILYSGAVYVFANSEGVWTETQELSANDGVQLGLYGVSVALDGARALVGSASVNASVGRAYLYTSSAGVWTQTQEFLASDGAVYDQYGWSVALGGSTALVGAPSDQNPAGAAYFYTPQPQTPPSAAVTPGSLTFVLPAGGNGSSPLNIGNTGESDLTWAMAEAAGSISLNSSGAVTGYPAGSAWVPSSGAGGLSFVLDNGNHVDTFGLASGPPAIFLNRFSPPAGTGAFTIDSISVMWPQQSNGSGSLVGQQANLVAYYDADNDNDPSNAVRLGGDHIVTIANLESFTDYTVNFLVPGDGDIYVGFEYAPTGVAPFTKPLATDENTPVAGLNSWFIHNGGPDLDLNNLGNDSTRAIFGAVGLHWDSMIRATGLSGPCSNPADVPWLRETPVNGLVAGGASQDVTVTADTTGLDPGSYSATLCVTTNDPANSLIQIPVGLTVLAPGDRVFASGFEGP